MRAKRYQALFGALAVSALVLSACSSGTSESAGSAEASAAATAAAESAAPAESAGLVGFSYPIEANTYLKAIGLGAQAQLMKQCGAEFYPVDAQLDGNKQISDVEAMITKGVDAMIIYPLDSNGLKPALDKASEAGIK
ncbi:MAG: sugar ABC transporter substrate-binding protein, partial [Actinomycetales bacterium]